MKLKIGKRLHYIDSYADASAVWSSYRPRYAGASKAPRVQVVEDDGTLRNVSWNGNVWQHATGRDWQPGDQPLYSPYA